jgi:hypothetical protein
MTEEDEAFNEIEKRSKVKQTLVKAQLDRLESQEPVCPECKAEVLYECVACSSNNYPPQEQNCQEEHMRDLVYRLQKRAEIRRQISVRKSVQEGKPDRIADLLDEAADALLKKKNT